jgi:DNA-directed RNA polymerase subunit beta'
VEELFEARDPKGEALMAEMDGTIRIVNEDGQRRLKVASSRVHRDQYEIPSRAKVLVKDGDKIPDGTRLIKPKTGNPIVAAKGGEVIREDGRIIIRYDQKDERLYEIPAAARLRVEDGQRVRAGDQLTEGSRNPHRILSILGRETAQLYLVEEVQRVYRSQGVNINDKHIEMILRQMFRKVRIKSTGDTDLLPGQLVDRLVFEDINAKVVERGNVPAAGQPVLLGVTKASLNTESFLSASSFQHTITVLSEAAIAGKRDELYGLKENVIIGKLIPAGTGFRARKSMQAESLDTLGRRGHRLNEDIRLEDEELAEAEEFEEMLVARGGIPQIDAEEEAAVTTATAVADDEAEEPEAQVETAAEEADDGDLALEGEMDEQSLESEDDELEDEDEEAESDAE